MKSLHSGISFYFYLEDETDGNGNQNVGSQLTVLGQEAWSDPDGDSSQWNLFLILLAQGPIWTKLNSESNWLFRYAFRGGGTKSSLMSWWWKCVRLYFCKTFYKQLFNDSFNKQILNHAEFFNYCIGIFCCFEKTLTLIGIFCTNSSESKEFFFFSRHLYPTKETESS